MVAQEGIEFGKGSGWCRWEPHIHAPGTLINDQYPKENGWEQFLLEIESASPAMTAIGITDYWTIDSYKRLRSEKENGRLPKCELLFPNIEMRFETATRNGNSVNAHLLVSPEDPNHVEELEAFLARLTFKTPSDVFPCTKQGLVKLGYSHDPDCGSNELALKIGASQFKITIDHLFETWNRGWPEKNIVIAVAGNEDGQGGVRGVGDQALRDKITKSVHAIFDSNSKSRIYWLGSGAKTRAQLELKHGGVKPCLWGSDAHSLERVGRPDGNRLCWIKGKVTFDALRQVLIDPERAFVGETAPSEALPSQVIDSLKIVGTTWAKTSTITLNPGLVAIIGARGSGKSALAEMIATGCCAYRSSKGSFLDRAKRHLDGASIKLK